LGALRRVIFLSKLFFVKKVSSDGLVVFLSRKTSLRLSIPYEHEAVHVLWGHRNIKSGIVVQIECFVTLKYNSDGLEEA
jgi:hypothetical protein